MTNFSGSKHAFNNFGMNNSLLTGFKHKFTFFVEFQISQSVDEALKSINMNDTSVNEYNKGLSFEVKTADRPSLNIDLQTLNEYNRKRVIQQHIEYQDFNIHFYDVGLGAKMVKDYLKFYYADFRHTDASAWNDSGLLSSEFNMDTWGFGFQPISNNQYFFDYITLYQLHSYHKYDAYTFIHPKIKSANFGESDYSVSDIHTINLTFAYEGLVIKLGETLENKHTNAFRLDVNSTGVELENGPPASPGARTTPTIRGETRPATLGNTATNTSDIKKILDQSNNRSVENVIDEQPSRIGSSILDMKHIGNDTKWSMPKIPSITQLMPSDNINIT
jgi:hypothetical protein